MAHRLRAVAVDPVGGASLRPLSREVPGGVRPRGRALDRRPSASLPLANSCFVRNCRRRSNLWQHGSSRRRPLRRNGAPGRSAVDRTARGGRPSRVGLQPVGALLVRAKGWRSGLKKRRCAGTRRLLGEGGNGGLSGNARTAAAGGSDRDVRRRRSGRPHHERQGWRRVVQQWLRRSDVGLGYRRMESLRTLAIPVALSASSLMVVGGKGITYTRESLTRESLKG